MWPFTRRRSIAQSGILNNFTDWHSHILPGVDDGIPTLDEALQILSQYEQAGIREVWLTPHIMDDIPNATATLREHYAQLKDSYRGHIILHLAAEYMLDNLLEQRLTHDDLLPIGTQGRHLLVETSYFNPPYGLHDILQHIKSKGYTPILAHPERYVYMDHADYQHLHQHDIAFQLNLPSIVGAYGNDAKRKAQWLLKNMYYQFTGTDTHKLTTWKLFTELKVSEDLLRMLCNQSI